MQSQPWMFLKNIITHPANQDRKLKAALESALWQLHKRSNKNQKIIPYHGLKFICFKDSHSSSSVIYFDQLPDFNEMMFIKSYLEPGDRFIDIGANIGIYSLLAASLVGAKGHIDAFEANPSTLDMLTKQIEINDLSNVTLHSVIVSDQSGQLEFELSDSDCTSHISPQSSSAANKVSLDSITLDDYLDTNTQYKMGKMDIEGAEILALKGAEKMLSNANPPVWQLELAGYSKRYGYRSDQVLDYLKAFDFNCAVYDPALQELNYTDEPWVSGHDNILAIHSSVSP